MHHLNQCRGCLLRAQHAPDAAAAPELLCRDCRLLQRQKRPPGRTAPDNRLHRYYFAAECHKPAVPHLAVITWECHFMLALAFPALL